uniref:Thioredoxin domain-containing protein n=1 Tax=Megaselia scalaris TaxID=36166 RepID=T1GTU1_MEGSC
MFLKSTIKIISKVNFSLTSTLQRTIQVQGHSDFDKKVVGSSRPVIAYFYAEWCDLCKQMTPKMRMRLENSEEIDLAMINVEDNVELVKFLNIKSVPNAYAYKDGKILGDFVGVVEDSVLDDLIKKLS